MTRRILAGYLPVCCLIKDKSAKAGWRALVDDTLVGPDTDLRRYGLRLCERGGKNAKKRAAVGVARKLAVLLHRLWVRGEVYEPLRQGMSATMTPAAA